MNDTMNIECLNETLLSYAVRFISRHNATNEMHFVWIIRERDMFFPPFSAAIQFVHHKNEMT